jgi:hypothetical protein
MKDLRLALARMLFNAGLSKLGGLLLKERDALFLDDGRTMVFCYKAASRPESGGGE